MLFTIFKDDHKVAEEQKTNPLINKYIYTYIYVNT